MNEGNLVAFIPPWQHREWNEQAERQPEISVCECCFETFTNYEGEEICLACMTKQAEKTKRYDTGK